jgi:hypothetical protein
MDKYLMAYNSQLKTIKNEANSNPFLTKSVPFAIPMVSNLFKTNPIYALFNQNLRVLKKQSQIHSVRP